VASRAGGHRDRAERGARPHRRLAPVRPGDPVPGRGAHRDRRTVPRERAAGYGGSGCR
jgi:hypothetical protein